MEQGVTLYAVQDIGGTKSIVEHCSFEWTIEDFLPKSQSKSDKLEAVFFAASNKEAYTLWHLRLVIKSSINDIEIGLKRLRSKNEDLVFVRFRWEILDTDGNKVFPGSIHAFAYPDDNLSRKFIERSTLLEDAPRFLPRDKLHILCELSVYDRTEEENISMAIKGNIRYTLNGLTEDLESLFLKQSGADLCVSSMDNVIFCHKSILSVRSHVFARMIENNQSDDNYLELSELKGDVLHAILMYIYTGNLDMYFEHTIPTDLYSAADKYGLTQLKQYLDCVNSNGLTNLKFMDVTWKIPSFKALLLQSEVVLHCPYPNSSTFYDKRWCFQLNFDSSSEEVHISVVRKQDERSKHFVKFNVQITKLATTVYEDTTYHVFHSNGKQEKKKFLNKSDLIRMLSFDDILVLKCTLEVLNYTRHPSCPREPSLKTLIKELSDHTEVCFLKLSEDLKNMLTKEKFSDSVVNTKLHKIRYHSYLAVTRFNMPERELRTFMENLESEYVKDFFYFLYGGDIVKRKAIAIKQIAQRSSAKCIMDKLSAFLDLYYK